MITSYLTDYVTPKPGIIFALAGDYVGEKSILSSTHVIVIKSMEGLDFSTQVQNLKLFLDNHKLTPLDQPPVQPPIHSQLIQALLSLSKTSC